MAVCNPVYTSVLPIFTRAEGCTQCYGNTPLHVPRPDRRNGAKGVEVMFINERPGRAGTGATGCVSFHNPDPSARTFRCLFESTGLPRERIFITNAVLCYPRTEKYRDMAPSRRQRRNCSQYLAEQIELLRPRLLVPCGTSAREALCLLYPSTTELRRFRLKDSIGTDIRIRPEGPWVYPVYHTSQRVLNTWRSLTGQLGDWARIPALLQQMKGPAKEH